MHRELILTFTQIFIFTTLYTVAYTSLEGQYQKKILFTRHGARSPNKYTELDQILWNDFTPGFLTKKGFQQVKSLGQYYQQDTLYDQNGDCVYENMHIEASTKQRVMISTIAFITGLCPKNYETILRRFFREYYTQYALVQEELEQIIASDFSDPFLDNYDNFERPNDFLFHGHDSDVCPILDIVEELVLESDEFLRKTEEFKERTEFTEVLTQMQIADPLKNYTKQSLTINKMKTFYGGYRCNQYEGFELPELSKEAQAYLMEIFLYKFYYIDNSQMEQHQSAVTEIAKWIIRELFSDVPFSWYSGHDSNQIAILSLLTDQQLFPPFAANLELTIYGDYVNVYFLGERIQTKLCSSGINCSRLEVVTYLEQYIVEDLQQFCRLP